MEINSQQKEKSLKTEQLIFFPEGLLGFESLKEFKIFSSDSEENLHWLQPVDDPEIEFAVTFPQIYQINYEISLNNDEEKLLEIGDEDEIVVLVTLSKKAATQDNESLLSANFIAPIVINITKQLGLQKILSQGKNPITITMKG